MRTAKELPRGASWGNQRSRRTVADNAGHRGRSRACGQPLCAHGASRLAAAEQQETQHPRHLGRRHRLWNVSAYNQGMMGYKTPNIDRIAKEGALSPTGMAQQSCTAGRACFITGQCGFRTGMLKVGLPGAKEGLKARDVTIAELLKAQGYMTAQFGKNHLGDRDEHLPTAHGFDEFFGSLYHLNAEEEPENPDYFKDPAMSKKYGTRGVIHTWANPGRHAEDREHRPADQEAHGDHRRGNHQGLARLHEGQAKKADKPFFLWWNSTRMHIWTHLKPGVRRARPASASIPTAWSSTTRTSASARQAQGTRPR